MKTSGLLFIIAMTLSIQIAGQNGNKSFVAHEGSVTKIRLSPDGTKLLTSGMDGRANLWDTRTLKKLKIYKGFSENPAAVSFDQSARNFITEGSNGKLVIWDEADFTPVKTLDCFGERITHLVTDPFNKFVAGASEKNVHIWDFSGAHIKSIDLTQVSNIEFSPDGRYLAVSNSEDLVTIYSTKVWEIKNQNQVKVKELSTVSISPNGENYVAGGKGGVFYVYNLQDKSLVLQEKSMKQDILKLQYSHNGEKIFIATANQLFAYNLDDKSLVELFNNKEKNIIDYTINHHQGLAYIAFTNGEIQCVEKPELKSETKILAVRNGKIWTAISNVEVKEKNGNGMVEKNEDAFLTLYVENNGESPVYNAEVQFSMTNEIGGLEFPGNYYLGNLDVGQVQRVKIKLLGNENLESATSSIIVRITDDAKIINQPYIQDITTLGNDIPSYLIVEDFMITSPTGKVEKNTPITLRILLRNITGMNSTKSSLKFKFPPNVVALDKIVEDLSEVKPNETKEISVQFMPQKEFTDEKISIGFEISGNVYSNIDDIDLNLKLGHDITKHETGELAFVKQDTQTATYRGGGDPLLGLNVSYSGDEFSPGNYYALVIGVDSYKGHWQPLKNAVNDAKAVSKILKEDYNFTKVTSLFNEQATRDNIIKELEQLVSSVTNTDNVLIYYSGHGEFSDVLNKGYWIPSDATSSSTAKYISNSDIQTYLGGIRSKHTLLISDACFSGDIFRGNVITVPFEKSVKYFSKIYNITSRKAITSGGMEPVLDGGKDGHSVFAYYLLKSLKDNKDKYLDANQLYESIKIPVINNSEQTPRYNPIKNTGDEGGQFIFIKK